MPNIVFNVTDYTRDPPLSEGAREATIHEFRTLGRLCFSPLPVYQCFSLSPDALDDKIIATARDASTNTLLAFASTVVLPGCTLPSGAHSGPIWHTGLTCIHPDHQRSGFTISLFASLYLYMLNERWPDGVWATCCAGVPSSLVSIQRTMTNAYPSPTIRTPTDNHRAIARHFYAMYRDKILVSDEATFDDETFVVKNSCSIGSPFRKTSGYTQYAHRDASANAFYLGLLSSDRDEVLQVGGVEEGES